MGLKDVQIVTGSRWNTSLCRPVICLVSTSHMYCVDQSYALCLPVICLVSISHINLFLIRSCFKLCFTFKTFDIFHSRDTHLRSVSNGSCVFDSNRITNEGILFVCFLFVFVCFFVCFVFLNSFFFFFGWGYPQRRNIDPLSW